MLSGLSSSPHVFEARCTSRPFIWKVFQSKLLNNPLQPRISWLHLPYLHFSKKKKKNRNLTQNCPKHYRWLQKTISCYYYVSDFIQLLIRKIIRAAFRDASFSYSLLSSDCAHFGDFLSRRLHLHRGVPLAWVNCFAINLSNDFWSSLVLHEPSHSVAVRSANCLWIV